MSWLFEKFILKSLYFDRVLEVSKANEKQRRSDSFCVGPSAKRVFNLACIDTNPSIC